jgi:Ni/Co efflux regulator RcnB
MHAKSLHAQTASPRRVDNNYVLAAAATGLIAGLVLANH